MAKKTSMIVNSALFCEENNMGNMDAQQAEAYFNAVKEDLGLSIGFAVTPTAPSICLGDKILLCENDLQYPWFTKMMILHETTHHLTPEDHRHGTTFHHKFAELVLRFLAGEGHNGNKDEG